MAKNKLSIYLVKEEKYKENFEWIDNIKEVKSKSEKEQLDELIY